MPIFKKILAWLTAFSLLFMSYFGAQIWHKPTLNGTHFDFTDVVLNTRGKVTAWNACCRANWCIGLGILVFICDQSFIYAEHSVPEYNSGWKENEDSTVICFQAEKSLLMQLDIFQE